MNNSQLRRWLSAAVSEGGTILTAGFLPEPVPATAALNGNARPLIDFDDIDPSQPPAAPASGFLAVLTRTFTDLRRVATLSSVLPPARHVLIAVAEPGHRGIALPRLSSAGLTDFVVRRGERGEWAIEATFRAPVETGELLASVARAVAWSTPLPVQRVALAGPGAAHWRPGDPGAQLTTQVGPLTEPEFIPTADLVLRSVPDTPPGWTDDRVEVIDRMQPGLVTWEALGRLDPDDTMARMAAAADPAQVPPIDELMVNPTGFLNAGTAGTAELRQAGGLWAIVVDDQPVLRIHPSGAITDVDIARLREYRAVRVVFGRHSGPVAAVRAVAGLACAGVPLVASEVPGWAAGLGDELTRLLTAHSIDDLTDDLTREVHSIRLRRAALRTHSARARWTAFARSAALPTPRADVSVVMCTMRPDFVAPALEQIGRQSYPDVEVVLVLHGVPANLPEIRAAVAGFERPITVVEAEAAIPFGAALNQGVAVASGHLVTKWDDDDWYGPEHIADLVLAKQYSGAELVGGAKGMAYLEEINLSVYQQSRNEQYDKYMTGCTMLADRHVVCELGWFRPHPRAVDTGLWNAVRAAGGRTYTTHGLNCVVVRRVQGHTWSASFTKFLRGISHQWRGINLGPLITSDQKLDLGSHTP